MQPGFQPAEIDTSKPHPARLYDYFLGGKDNYPVDQQAAREILRIVPEMRAMARANRAFLRRAVRFLVADAGIRQIIDIGTGIPTAGNVHEVAHQIAPGTRVAYVDNDPIVHVHASALLTGAPSTRIVLADLREPSAILAHPSVTELIDFSQPVALLLIAILHFITTPKTQSSAEPGSTTARPPRSGCAATPRSASSSTASTSSSLAWCKCRCGAQTASRPAPATSPRSPSMAGSAAAAHRPPAAPGRDTLPRSETP